MSEVTAKARAEADAEAKANSQYLSIVRQKNIRVRWNEWIRESFKNRPCVFGSLVYPRLPHLTDIPKSVRIYTEQVLQRSIKHHPEPLRRVFVVEQTPGEEFGKSRITLIPIDGELRHVLIKEPRKFAMSRVKGMPDIPHIHFLMEVPSGLNPADFVTLCENRWNRMNWDRKNPNLPSLAKVEVVRDLYATTRYVTKEFVKTKGKNIILTHATMLQQTA